MKSIKKIVALLLTAVLLCGCASEAATESTTPDYSQYAGIVADPKSWYEELMALPIANADMTEDELRQLCADAFRLNLSFTWTPTKTIAFGFTLLEKSYSAVLPEGIAYSGLFYNNNTAQGNVWKALDFYDPETGTLDNEAMGGYMMNILGSACARGALWGWGRVCNESNLDGMTTFQQYSANIVPVGPYNYPPGKYALSHGDGTKRLVADNGRQTMFESYAAMKTADGLYSSSAYHVMMCAAPGEVVCTSDGTIDSRESYIFVHEQSSGGTLTQRYNFIQENGVVMRPLGTVFQKVTFEQLYRNGYVPFALKELIGEGTIEPGNAWLEDSDGVRLENGMRITIQEMLASTLRTNYAVCTFEFQVKNPKGKVLFTYDPRFMTSPTTYKIQLHNISMPEEVETYANGRNTIHTYVRMSNGELLEAFQTVLIID